MSIPLLQRCALSRLGRWAGRGWGGAIELLVVIAIYTPYPLLAVCSFTPRLGRPAGGAIELVVLVVVVIYI